MYRVALPAGRLEGDSAGPKAERLQMCVRELIGQELEKGLLACQRSTLPDAVVRNESL